MPIDFHAETQRHTYARRRAGADWASLIRSIVDPRGARVVDVGCGGGVYCAAWLDLGAASVVGVDFSAAILAGAAETQGSRAGLSFRQGDALATGLPAGSADVVFERALVHHLDDLEGAFSEARRLLAAGGRLIVQDRTLEDVTRPGSPSHLRGYFFERFPWLLDVERHRRPSTAAVLAAMHAAGLRTVRTVEFAEVRREYDRPDEIRADLLARTGRSILHELTDDQLSDLADFVADQVAAAAGSSDRPIREVDHWTVWVAAA